MPSKEAVTNVIPSTELRNNLSDTLDKVEQDGIALISRHRDVDVALVNTDLLEDLLELRDQEYLKSITKAREDINKGRVKTIEQAFGDLLD